MQKRMFLMSEWMGDAESEVIHVLDVLKVR